MKNFENSLQKKDKELKNTNPGELSKDSKEKQDKLLYKHLENRFAKEILPVLKSGGTNNEGIEKIKDIWIKNEKDVAEDIEFINSKAETAHDKFIKSIFDSVSGLQRREGLYMLMDSVLNDSLGDIEDEEKLLDILKNEKKLTKEDKECSVMMGDVSFLSLVNEAGHASGDELIWKICDALKNAEKSANMVSARHGGDELSALHRDSTDNKIEETVEKIQSLVKNTNIDKLNSYGLKPNIDYGVAFLSEAYMVVKNILNYPKNINSTKNIFINKNNKFNEDYNPEKEFIKKGVKNELKDIWIDIADKRCFLEKCDTRIKLLVALFHEDRKKYNEVISFLRKGAYNITDEEVENFSNIVYSLNQSGDIVTDTDNKFKEEIQQFILEKEKGKLLDTKGYKKIRNQCILEQAWR